MHRIRLEMQSPYEPPLEKTYNVIFEHVQHTPTCMATEDS